MKIRNGNLPINVVGLLLASIVPFACLIFFSGSARAQRPLNKTGPPVGQPERVPYGELTILRDSSGRVVKEETRDGKTKEITEREQRSRSSSRVWKICARASRSTSKTNRRASLP